MTVLAIAAASVGHVSLGLKLKRGDVGGNFSRSLSYKAGLQVLGLDIICSSNTEMKSYGLTYVAASKR